MLYTLREVLELRTAVQRFNRSSLESHDLPPLNPDRSAASDHTVVVGPDPIRILFFGAGALMGYGVNTRRQAVDGRLAQLISDATGRGVIVENRTVQHLTLAKTFKSLGAVGTHTFHVAVWSPGYLEGTSRVLVHTWRSAAERWRSAVAAVLESYQRTSTTPLVIVEFAMPAGPHRVAQLLRRGVAVANRGIRTAAAAASVPVVSLPALVVREQPEPVFDGETNRAVAERLAPAVLAAIGVRSASGPTVR